MIWHRLKAWYRRLQSAKELGQGHVSEIDRFLQDSNQQEASYSESRTHEIRKYLRIAKLRDSANHP